MITINNSKVVDIPKISEVWVNNYKVWPDEQTDDIISCFARGYWIPAYPWTSSLGWKNNI